MSAGELGFDDLAFDDNPLYGLTFVLFTILVLFVIMNLMTSLAVNDIAKIRNRSRDGTWYKLMYTLKWYAALSAGIKNPSKDENGSIISFKLNEVPSLTNPKSWFNYITRMPKTTGTSSLSSQQILDLTDYLLQGWSKVGRNF